MQSITFTFFGDGAVNQGQVYEAFQYGSSLAASYNLYNREQSIWNGNISRKS